MESSKDHTPKPEVDKIIYREIIGYPFSSTKVQ